MRNAAGAARVVGECAVCHFPVRAVHAVRVQDLAVSATEGRPVRRLAHRGECEGELRERMAGPPVRGFEP